MFIAADRHHNTRSTFHNITATASFAAADAEREVQKARSALPRRDIIAA